MIDRRPTKAAPRSWYGIAMATPQQIASSFNANFKRLSGGQGADVLNLGDRRFRATFYGLDVELEVPDSATELNLNNYTQMEAARLWTKVTKKR